MVAFVVAAILASLSSSAMGFYLPGVAPHNFYAGEPVGLKVNKLRYNLLLQCRLS